MLPPRLDVCTVKCNPYSVRDIRTLTILHPSLSTRNLGQFVHPLLHLYWLRTLSVLSLPISANLNKIPYCLHTLYAKFLLYTNTVVCAWWLLQQYPAENLLKNDSFKKWKCTAGEKQASVVFQVTLSSGRTLCVGLLPFVFNKHTT